MEEDLQIYDDAASVAYIRNFLPQEAKAKLSDDDIIYIVDLVYDFYESRGYMDMAEDSEDVIEIDEDELVEYVMKNAKRDEVGNFSAEEIRFVVQGELEYCESINLFED